MHDLYIKFDCAVYVFVMTNITIKPQPVAYFETDRLFIYII